MLVEAVLSTLALNCLKTAIAEDGFCFRKGDEISCYDGTELNLSRIDGKQVNHTWDVPVNDNQSVTLRTISMKPLLIEIPHFLSNEESDHIVNLAKAKGMTNSVTQNLERSEQYLIYDLDGNKRLSLEEMHITIENAFDVYFDDDDILKMYKELGMDKNGDGEITQDEMSEVPGKVMHDYIKAYVKEHPEKHSRFSEQAWLFPEESSDDIFITVQKRLAKVLELPVEFIRMSDFQIVHYGIKGHYNAHYDSSFNQSHNPLPCCLRFNNKKKCRICRFLTALFYLNNVKKGGETAFPIANNDTVDLKEYHQTHFNLYTACPDVAVKVAPQKGKAVIWYNHFIDPDTQWLGTQDPYTLHGGCAVVEGEKWIGNFWVRATFDKAVDLQLMEKLRLQ